MGESLRKIVGGGYDEFWNTRCRYRVVKGSRGSKKSTTTALWLIYNMMMYYSRYKLKPSALVIRKYGYTHRDSTRSQLLWAMEKLGVRHLWKVPKSDNTLTYIPSGQKILFRGLDDAQSITSITVEDGHLCWVWFEECFQITSEEEFDKVDMSLRGELPPQLFLQITLTFNPWSDRHWLKRKFFDVKDDDIFAITTTYKCNEFLSEMDIALYEKMKEMNPRRYKIEGEGEWGISEGLIYEKWKIQDFNISDLIQKHLNDRNFVACNGIDFGYTDPTAFVASYADKKNYQIWVYFEFCETTMENKKIATKIILGGFQNAKIMADSEDPRTINELRLLGLYGMKPCKKGTGSVLGGIQRLQDYEIIIHPSCTSMIESISNYAWSKDKQTDRITNIPEHEFSHCCVTGDTLVNTSKGKVRIDEIKEGMMIWSYDIDSKNVELNRCSCHKLTGKHERIYELELKDGQILRCTGDHKVLTRNGYVECRNLSVNDEVIVIRFDTLRYVTDNITRGIKCLCRKVKKLLS